MSRVQAWRLTRQRWERRPLAQQRLIATHARALRRTWEIWTAYGFALLATWLMPHDDPSACNRIASSTSITASPT